MKKTLLIVLALVMAFMMITGCTQRTEEPDAASAPAADTPAAETPAEDGEEQPFVALASNCTDGFYVKKYISRFEEICKEKDYKYVIMDGNFDGPTQVGQIENLIAQEVDVIFVIPCDSNAVVEPVKKAYEAGIPVIASHGRMAPEANDYILGFAGCLDENLGNGAGELIYEACGGEGNLLIVGSGYGSETITAYMNCVQEKIGDKINVLAELEHGWDRTKAYEAMENALTQYDNIDVVWAFDDNTAIGCVNAIKDAGREGIKVVGINGQDIAFEAIEAGEMYGTVIQNPSENVDLMFEMWDKWKAGEDYDFEMYSKSPVITAENISEYEPVF